MNVMLKVIFTCVHLCREREQVHVGIVITQVSVCLSVVGIVITGVCLHDDSQTH